MEMYNSLLDLEMLPERIQVAPGQEITRECIRTCTQLRHIPEEAVGDRLDCIDQRSAEGLIMSCSGPTPNQKDYTCRLPEETKVVTNERIRNLLRNVVQVTSVEPVTKV